MSSLTLVLSGNSSSLRADYFPPIELDHHSDYECCLIDFHTYNTIPNINETNNKFHVNFHTKFNIDPKEFTSLDAFRKIIEELMESDKKWTKASTDKLDWMYHLADYRGVMGGDLNLAYHVQSVYEIPVGCYEMDDIIDILSNKLDSVHVTYDKNTARTTISIEDEHATVDFTQPNSIRNVLGFSSAELSAKQKHVGDYAINITPINVVRVECSIVTGSFINAKNTHTLHEFYPVVPAGYKIVEVPKNLIYLPVVDRTIRTIHFDIVDQNGNLIDFRDETITCRIHIRKV